MSPLEPEIPPAGEEIHLPGPQHPAAAADGRHHAGAGRRDDVLDRLAIAGGILVDRARSSRWIRDTRRDIDELPLEPLAD